MYDNYFKILSVKICLVYYNSISLIVKSYMCHYPIYNNYFKIFVNKIYLTCDNSFLSLTMYLILYLLEKLISEFFFSYDSYFNNFINESCVIYDNYFKNIINDN